MAALWHLLQSLVRSAGSSPANRAYFQEAVPLSAAGHGDLALHTAAFTALLDWPHGFHSFLNRLAERPDRTEPGGVVGDLMGLWETWNV